MAVLEHTIELAGAPVFYREGPGPADPPLYLHSVPTSSDDWLGFLERGGGLAPDLPGFGRSGKAGNLDYSLPGYVSFVEALLRATGREAVTIVGHGWGAAIGLAFATRHPDRVRDVVVIDGVPLFDGFRWPRLIRRLRTPVLGELMMGAVNRWVLARLLRSGSADPRAWTADRVEAVWQQFDQGTQRAILRLHRSIDPAGLTAAGTGLEHLSGNKLVLWGERDAWLSPELSQGYAERLAGATVERVPRAGHWPWMDVPEVIDRVVSFTS